MSFHEITGKPATIPLSPDDFPRFILPDVTGDSLGLFQLGTELQTAMGNKGQIYLWHDPEPSEAGKSLDTYAAKIAEDIIKLQPAGPIYLSGFSAGSILAKVVAQKLRAQSRKVAFFGIDSPSVEGSQNYLSAKNPKATVDLFNMFKYAAEMAGHHAGQKPQIPVFSEEAMSTVCARPFEEQIAFFADRFTQANAASTSADFKSRLAKYAARITQSLLGILQHKGETSLDPLDKIGLFFSEESQKKYPFDVAKSWETHGVHPQISLLPGSGHLSLLRNKMSCKAVATAMANFFRKCFSPVEIMTMLFTAWEASNPSLDRSELYQSIQKSKPAEAKMSPAQSHSFSEPPSPLSSPQLSPALSGLDGSSMDLPQLDLPASAFQRSAPIAIPGARSKEQKAQSVSLPNSFNGRSPSEDFSGLQLTELPMELTDQPKPRKKKAEASKPVYLEPPIAAFFPLPPQMRPTRLQQKKKDVALLSGTQTFGFGIRPPTPTGGSG